MVEGLIGGGIYLTRLDPAKGAEIGKLRPIALLSAPERLGAGSPAVVHLPPEQPIRALLRIRACGLAAAQRPQGREFRPVEHYRAISRKPTSVPEISTSAAQGRADGRRSHPGLPCDTVHNNSYPRDHAALPTWPPTHGDADPLSTARHRPQANRPLRPCPFTAPGTCH